MGTIEKKNENNTLQFGRINTWISNFKNFVLKQKKN